MKKKSFLIAFAFCVIAVSLVQCNSKSKKSETGDTAADVAAIQKADSLWAVAAGTKQMDNFMSAVANDGVILAPNAPIADNPDAIKNLMNVFFNLPGYALTWQTAKVEVAGSGDLAYSRGVYQLNMNDAQGKPMTEKGKYLTIWKKQSDGSWKVAVDQFNSDMPAAPPPQK